MTARWHVSLVGLLAAVLFWNGCSTTPTIQYRTVLPAQQANHVTVTIREFNDSRQPFEKGAIGSVRNAYGLEMGMVAEPPEMLAHVAGALKAELINSGYDIVSSGDADFIISADVTTVTCDVGNTKSAQVKIKFQVRQTTDRLIENIYHGTGSDITFLGIDCSKPLNEAIRNVMSQFVSDLNRYVAQHNDKSIPGTKET